MARYRKRFIPKLYFEVFQCALLILLAGVTLFHDLYLLSLMASTYSHETCVALTILLLYISVNVVGNFVQFILIDTSILTFASFNDIKADWQVCPSCELQVPPRSYHCNVCNICILKRDHHCVFTGCCSGYFNHRYYVGLLTHLWCGAALSIFLNCCGSTMVTMFGSSGWWSILYSLFPVIFWLTGFTDSSAFVTFLMSAVALYGWFFLTGLSLYHWNLILRGQTAFENLRNVKIFSFDTWQENVTEVLGFRWIAVILWFGVSSPLPGDGQTFSVGGKTQ